MMPLFMFVVMTFCGHKSLWVGADVRSKKTKKKKKGLRIQDFRLPHRIILALSLLKLTHILTLYISFPDFFDVTVEFNWTD